MISQKNLLFSRHHTNTEEKTGIDWVKKMYLIFQTTSQAIEYKTNKFEIKTFYIKIIEHPTQRIFFYFKLNIKFNISILLNAYFHNWMHNISQHYVYVRVCGMLALNQ